MFSVFWVLDLLCSNCELLRIELFIYRKKYIIFININNVYYSEECSAWDLSTIFIVLFCVFLFYKEVFHILQEFIVGKALFSVIVTPCGDSYTDSRGFMKSGNILGDNFKSYVIPNWWAHEICSFSSLEIFSELSKSNVTIAVIRLHTKLYIDTLPFALGYVR